MNALYFNNRGIPDRFDGKQYSWKTRFTNVSGVVFLPAEIEILGQFMSDDTEMGFRGPDEPTVTSDFRSWYLLWSIPWGSHRFSVRYKDFRVWDRDRLRFPTSSNETGNAWTFSYLMRIADRHRVAVELLRIDSIRPARPLIGLRSWRTSSCCS